MPDSPHKLEYGPVFILKGYHKGRIGYYDDDDCDDDGNDEAIVYFGQMFLCSGGYGIPLRYLRQANTNDLMKRKEIIWRQIGMGSDPKISIEEKYDLLLEKHYIDGVLDSNIIELWFGKNEALKGARVFLSHSSKDKGIVNQIATDLTKLGIAPWLDEWKIRAGDSIPNKISKGIKDSECVVVFLSKNAIVSKWVEQEWEAKYWDEIQRNQIFVIPALLEDCEIPELLKTKKFADFRGDYDYGLRELILTLTRRKRP